MFYPCKALPYFQNHLFYLPKTPFPLIRYSRPRRYRQSIAVKYGGERGDIGILRTSGRIVRRKRTRPSDYYNSIYSEKKQDVTRFRLRRPVGQRKNENAPSRQSLKGSDKRAVTTVNITSSGKTKIFIAAGSKTILLIATERESYARRLAQMRNLCILFALKNSGFSCP